MYMMYGELDGCCAGSSVLLHVTGTNESTPCTTTIGCARRKRWWGRPSVHGELTPAGGRESSCDHSVVCANYTTDRESPVGLSTGSHLVQTAQSSKLSCCRCKAMAVRKLLRMRLDQWRFYKAPLPRCSR